MEQGQLGCPTNAVAKYAKIVMRNRLGQNTYQNRHFTIEACLYKI